MESSKEEILQMESMEIFKLAKDSGIPLDKCTNLDEWRTRVILHRKVLERTHFDIQKEFSQRHSESFADVCQRLYLQLERVQKILQNHPEVDAILKQALESQCRLCRDRDLLSKEVEAHRKALKDRAPSVIIAGETNAGKSTLLNLILGQNILPTSILSCTAAICKLRYCEEYKVEVVYENGLTDLKKFRNVEDAHLALTEVASESDDRRREQKRSIQVINIFLPAAVLISGVTLVDTPGIGESELMDNVTMNYVKKNSAAAYIYVIKTDNAGGVQDDRLLEFLRSILEYHNSSEDSVEIFNPSSAMFVCNRWDQVPDEQKERVRENAYKRLRDTWPGFETDQAFFISTTKADMHWSINPCYVTKEFEKLLRGMKEIFNTAAKNDINQHYRWIKSILHTCTNVLQVTIAQCSQTDDELCKRHQATADKLHALENRASSTVFMLRQKLELASIDLCRQVKNVLEEDMVVHEMVTWDHDLIPDISSSDNLNSISENEQARRGSGSSSKTLSWATMVDMEIVRRIVCVVDKTLTQNGIIHEKQTAFRQLAQQQLKLLDREMDDILSELKERNSLNSSVRSNRSSFSDEETPEGLLRLYRIRHERQFARLRNSYNQTPGASYTSETSLSKVIVGKIMSAVLAPVKIVKTRIRRTSIMSNPAEYMQKRSHKIVDDIRKNKSSQEQLVKKYIEQLESFIADIENGIPSFVSHSKQLISDIRQNRQRFFKQRKEMVSLMEHLEPERELLRGFGSLYLHDLTADNIGFALKPESRRQSVVVEVSSRSRSFDSGYSGSGKVPGSKIYQALWSSYRPGHITIGKEMEPVMSRSYNQPLSEDELLREIARLRCLRNPFVASFFGMNNMDGVAMFLFVDDMKPARRFFQDDFHVRRESVPRFLESLLNGLTYIHHNGMVHFELSLDTVMVQRVSGDVKLCGACLPRHARFPPDDHTVLAGPFVCLSPDVLRGDLYTADDDIYSFGLVAWEVCLPNLPPPYVEQREQPLGEFRRTVHPSHMLNIDSMTISDNLSAILRGCLLPGRGLRISQSQLQQYIEVLPEDASIQSLSDIVRRRHVYKDGRTSTRQYSE